MRYLDYTNMPVSEFWVLKENWFKEVSHLSGRWEENQWAIEMIASGENIVPHILYELEWNPSWWFGILTEITGVNLTTEINRGRLQPLADAWIAWGKENYKEAVDALREYYEDDVDAV